MKKFFKILTYCALSFTYHVNAFNSLRISKINVVGNAKVETEAITNIFESKEGSIFDQELINNDVKQLYELGYFSEIYVYKKIENNQFILTFKLKEKPAITAIEFTGLEEFKEEEIIKELQTKINTIVNEENIAHDLNLIERKYKEKGFFLNQATYSLVKLENTDNVKLVFKVLESKKVLVGDISILGNHFFSDLELSEKLLSKPFSRTTAITSGSIYNEDFLNRDVELLSFFYKDKGFADVKISKPIVFLDPDKSFTRITLNIEEGIQYNVKSIEINGDVGKDFYTKEFLLDKMNLKKQELFRYSFFSKDVEMLVDKYSDLGYAYVDVNPITKFNKDGSLDLTYEITKGPKIYFGFINIFGNSKTRDNVIRREIEISDGQLYSGTLLNLSKRNINRLGFFEEVLVQSTRRENSEDLVDININVKEKSTGQLQAAVGFSPGGETKASWFGQGRYEEKNQSGRGWGTGFSGRWAASNDFKLEVDFSNPKVNDGEWSLGLGISHDVQKTLYSSSIEIPEKRFTAKVTVGRSLFELVRSFIIFKVSNISQSVNDIYIYDGYKGGGLQNSITLGLSRNNLNNYIEPSKGLSSSIQHKFVGGLLKGDHTFMETSAETSYYFPIDLSESYRTYFKLHGSFGMLFPGSNSQIPSNERYRLGGYNNLRGYKHWEVSPIEKKGVSPFSTYNDFFIGGNKQIYFQIEYFIPLIPQAGIKGIIFADAGNVFTESEKISLTNLKTDVGFGFRWLTPMAPFRFEWAYPYNKKTGSFGDVEFIFALGY